MTGNLLLNGRYMSVCNKLCTGEGNGLMIIEN